MQSTSNIRRAVRWLLLSVFLSMGIGIGMGLAMAQTEPTMAEIYSTAQAGKLEQAQVMVQQVLVAHPNSAKAHFVQSELYARQGNLGRAREALASVEKIAPGLPFAKPEAVQALRTQLNAQASTPQTGKSTGNVVPANSAAPAGNGATGNGSGSGSGSGNWLLPMLLAGGVIAAAYFVFRRKTQPQVPSQPAYSTAMNNRLNGPQSFGNGAAAMPAGYGPTYGQPQGYGMGGRIMGGVATGLAVGAGVMAAQAIGRNLMGGHEGNAADGSGNGSASAQDFQNPSVNTDMGGQDFGINDTSTWDDGSSVDMGGGGGDWDT